ncbi:hypothetical protein [Pelagicoccus sp. SDUM812005]|uniref:hypothetical protein n=1 Tax=Pelagicoccus sp. SDUM812005 TaxID=3041257 RepID=UPI00280C74B7|nr:hypothetical protein [Pelagicoccus sp. SDUM812005]MDQ8182717.1 hypothetical protein [Pelagicoccus sp. SDUM812005]
MIEQIIRSIGGLAGIFNILGALFVIYLAIRHKKILAKYNHKLSIQLEAFRSTLETEKTKHSVVFTRLYEKREEALLKLWKALIHLRRVSLDASAVSPRCTLKEFLKIAQKTKEDFEMVEFYFPKEFCEDWYSAIEDIQNSTYPILQMREKRTDDWEKDRLSLKNSVDRFIRVWDSTKEPLRLRIQELIKVKELG